MKDDYINRLSFYMNEIKANQRCLDMLEREKNTTNPDYRFYFSSNGDSEHAMLASTVEVRQMFIDLYTNRIDGLNTKLDASTKEIAEKL